MKLYLVPTPIGNLGDITLRALETLKRVDLILCEDTRTSGNLLKHYEIKNTLFPYHQHNEHKVYSLIVEKLLSGQEIALITDAGTPGVSDPGFLLIRACIQHEIKVECLPGANAFVPALVQSGLPAHNFVFEGFLPLKKGRKTKLTELAEEERTIVLYESPHRILKSLMEFKEYFGEDRQVSISRELTKKFEETIRGTLSEVILQIENNIFKGEIVVVIEGKDKKFKK